MKPLPEELPEWLSKVIEGLDENASEMLRKGTDPSRAAGYFQCLAELRDEIDTEYQLEKAAKLKRFRELTSGAA